MRPVVGFVSLGCPKNLVDTERMISLLGNDGAIITGDQNKADIVVINTCGFLEAAKRESMDTIGEFVSLKKKGNVKGVVVAGCMTERYLGLMNETYPEVDAFIQVREFSKITEVVRKIAEGQKSELKLQLTGELAGLEGGSQELAPPVQQLQGHSELPDYMERTPMKRPFAYIKIAEGCNRTCSFCIIPKLRGKLHSRSIEGIVDETKRLAECGTKEIILIAQDLTSYGKDRSDGTTLLRLLEQLEEIEGIRWIKLMYNYPRFFTDELISFLASSEKFSRYLDIPFQHISNSVLKRMRRPETSNEIRELISKLRFVMPDISLRTTLMVGFPGETSGDFAELLDFIDWAKFDHLGAFTYFQEEDTPSHSLSDQLSEKVKQSRYQTLMEKQLRIQKQRLKSHLGSVMEVMIDGLAEKTKQGQIYRGRHKGQAPEIDGVTYVLEGDNRHDGSSSLLEIGEIYDVEVHKLVSDYDLLGMPVAVSREESSLSPAEVAQR